jgi:nucleoside 2-deoxyribosyltransferase
MTKRVYLAGPDVFYDNPEAHAEKLKLFCSQVGLKGVFPLDANISFHLSDAPEERARKIFEGNVALIRSCQGVLANMTPFRGPSTDVGTAWEMGFAHALGLPIVGYTDDLRPYEKRVLIPDPYMIENFGLTDNLMLACCIGSICGGAQSACGKLALLL